MESNPINIMINDTTIAITGRLIKFLNIKIVFKSDYSASTSNEWKTCLGS
jgi:hypothetical protein